MAALHPKFEYDIFISYRQNDNKYDGWINEFVEKLKQELNATIKDNLSIYFDKIPHAYIELINKAETGKEKPINGQYKHEVYKEAYDSFVEKYPN